MGAVEKKGEVMKQIKGVEEVRLLLLSDRVPVQAATKFKVVNVTNKTEAYKGKLNIRGTTM